MPLNQHRACVNCGDPVQGNGDLCSDCMPPDLSRADSICPYCEESTPWEKVRRYRRNHESGQVEVLYYCPACRGILEAACWMER